MIEPFSLSELGIFVGSCCAGLSGFIFALSKSRCVTIKCCGIECERDVIEQHFVSQASDPIEDDLSLTPSQSKEQPSSLQ